MEPRPRAALRVEALPLLQPLRGSLDSLVARSAVARGAPRPRAGFAKVREWRATLGCLAALVAGVALVGQLASKLAPRLRST